jgi:hypothetical protein
MNANEREFMKDQEIRNVTPWPEPYPREIILTGGREHYLQGLVEEQRRISDCRLPIADLGKGEAKPQENAENAKREAQAAEDQASEILRRKGRRWMDRVDAVDGMGKLDRMDEVIRNPFRIAGGDPLGFCRAAMVAMRENEVWGKQAGKHAGPDAGDPSGGLPAIEERMEK